MNPKVYEFKAVIQKVPDMDSAYIDLRAKIGKQPGDIVRVTIQERE